MGTNLKSDIRYGWIDRKVCEYACKKWHLLNYYYVNGIKTHKKTIYGQMQNWNKNNEKQYSNQLQFAKDHISADTYIAKDKGKYKYAYPLNKKMRKRLLKECIPYD